MKKLILTFILALTTLPTYAKVEIVRARELSLQYGIEIEISFDKEINAYASNDGSITFCQGLLDLNDFNEDQFLLVLFHEKTHLDKMHPQLIGQFRNILAILKNSIIIDRYTDAGLLQNVNIALTLLYANFSRILERQADMGAFEKLKSLGKDNKACELFKSVLKTSDKRSAWDDHDISKDRYEKCNEVLGK